mgnify:CR=1 FL=1
MNIEIDNFIFNSIKNIIDEPKENELSDDYPLGGMLEPYDIEKEKQL